MNKISIAIFQARVGSSRLPGKMFKKLGRFYLIEWAIKRLKRSKKNNFKIHSMKSCKDLFYPKLKFDVDTLTDLKYLSRIAKNKINFNTSARKIIKIALNEIKNDN